MATAAVAAEVKHAASATATCVIPDPAYATICGTNPHAATGTRGAGAAIAGVIVRGAAATIAAGEIARTATPAGG